MTSQATFQLHRWMKDSEKLVVHFLERENKYWKALSKALSYSVVTNTHVLLHHKSWNKTLIIFGVQSHTKNLELMKFCYSG